MSCQLVMLKKVSLYTYRAPGSRQYNENGSAYVPKEFDVLYLFEFRYVFSTYGFN